MKIGILTSGGDCPGLNAVIRGIVLKGTTTYDIEFVGFATAGAASSTVISSPSPATR